jgi:hypothetical protein
MDGLVFGEQVTSPPLLDQRPVSGQVTCTVLPWAENSPTGFSRSESQYLNFLLMINIPLAANLDPGCRLCLDIGPLASLE